MNDIQLEYFPYRLNFKYPFRLSISERTGTDNVFLLFKSGSFSAWGECVFIPYYTENLDSFKQFISEVNFPNSIEDIFSFIQNLKKTFPGNNFSIAAIDIGLHNLKSAITSQTIKQHYNLIGETPSTSFTIGISSDKEMIQKIEENAEMNYFKLKVNQNEIERIVSTILKNSSKPFTIDANQGFTDKYEALKWTYKLADLGVEYMEQPFNKEDYESHYWLKRKSPIPIIADESFQTYSDLEKLYKNFDGINVKTMKCGGISEAVLCLKRAREMELKSIIGCMSESSIAVNAAYEIASLADWVDLDGPLLINNDPFFGNKTNDEIISLLRNYSI